MKKENRKLAQERRAQEREKMEKQKKIRTGLMIGLPILAVVLILVIFAIPWGEGSKSNGSSDVITVQNEDPKLNMDPELVVEDGDKVNIDYVGSIDGVEFAGGNTKGMGTDLVIGSGTYIDDFEEQLIGHGVGESVDVVVTFPKNYGAADLAGKEAVFVTKINGIYK